MATMNPFNTVPALYTPPKFAQTRFLQVLMMLCALLASTLAPQYAAALASDRSQSITIQADSAERDEIKGTTTYAGNVVMQQGSMRINAEKIVIYNQKNKVTKIVALGNPAKYQQKPSATENLVIAQANTLEYDISAETLRLIESASLHQEGTSLSGNFINYDVKKSVVKAGGNTLENERVRMVIPARSLKQSDDPEAEAHQSKSASATTR